MSDITYYERLMAVAERIARHSWFPGKDRVIEDCVDDLEGLVEAGQISEDQAESVRDLLEGSRVNAA